MEKNKKEKNNYYIDPKRFIKVMNDYYYKRLENPNYPISNEIGEMLLLMCQKISTRYNFANYTYKDEFISEAIVIAIKAVKKYNPNISIEKRKDQKNKQPNPYGFFTQVIWNAFLYQMNKEKQQEKLRDKLLINTELFHKPEHPYYEDDITNDQIHGNFDYNNNY